MNTWWSDTYEQLAQGFMEGFVPFLFELIVAILLFIIGWFIAVFIGRIVAEILKKLKFNQIFEGGVWKEALEKADLKMDAAGFIGAIVKWVLVIVALWVALGFIDSLEPFTVLLGKILGYLPNVVIAAFIFVVAVIVADLLGKFIRAAVESIRVGYGHAVELIVKWAIIFFAFLAILQQLEFVAAEWIFTLIQIVIGGIVVAFAIAFGLGGKNVAAEILENLYRKLKG